MLHVLNYMVNALHLLQLTMFTNLCHSEYSEYLLLARMQSWIHLQHWSFNGISNILCAIPTHESIRRCLKSFTSCTSVWSTHCGIMPEI